MYAVLQNKKAEFNPQKETFHDIFQHMLNHKPNSRPPKIELTGILTPLRGSTKLFSSCKFKLETDSKEYLLMMSDQMAKVAKKIEWEEVTVKGLLDFETNVLEVEKISLPQQSDPDEVTTSLTDSQFEIENYKLTISKKGKLDLDVPSWHPNRPNC